MKDAAQSHTPSAHSASSPNLKRKITSGSFMDVVVESSSGCHHAAARVLHSPLFEHTIGTIIFVNFIVVIRETDIGANPGEESPVWLEVTGWALLLIFVVELVLKLYVLRRSFVNEYWNIFDFTVISVDLVMGIIGLVEKDMVDVSALRVLRLSRLARATKILRVFPELQLMVAGLAGAVQAIFWGTILIVFAVLVWSILAVQFIRDYNIKVADDDSDPYNGCARCRHAYDSVFQSAVTFFTQVVAGDSWGRETVPIVEAYPITIPFFLGVFLTIGLAILNLILGVVVNVATDARDGLQKQLEAERMIARSQSQKTLLRMCRQMDKDGNDELNKDELFRGYEENEQFRDLLQTLDIQREDLEIVWSLLDSDRSGTITSKEFVSQINTLKHTDTSYMLAYIKFYITDIKERIEKNTSLVNAQIDAETEVLSMAREAKVSPRTSLIESDATLRHFFEERERTSASAATGKGSRESVSAATERTTHLKEELMAVLSPSDIHPHLPDKICDEGVSHVNLKSIDILLESALMVAQLQATWQQMLNPITDMEDRHLRLAKDLKAMAPIKEPVELLSRVQTVWNSGLDCLQSMKASHTQLSNDLANIAPIKEPSALVPQLQDACQQCIKSSSHMLSRHSELCGKIESMIKHVNGALQDDCSQKPPPFKSSD